MSAVDGKPDLLRMRIWGRASGALVYDSQPGAALLAVPTATLRGSVTVH